MSLDDPHRRIIPEPGPPVAPPGPDRLALLADDVRSLRTALVLVGLLALAGVGLSVWSLLEGEDSDNARSSLRERTQQLDRRIDEVESDVRRTSEESDVTALERRLERTRSQVQEAEERSAETAEANDQLRGRISDLAETNEELADRVQRLEQDGGGDTDGDADAGAGTDTP
jgi:septal ring factor EnvC (AmiA/AmiB activator)